MNNLPFRLTITLALLFSVRMALGQVSNPPATNGAALRLEIKDEQGAGIEGATVTAVSATGTEFPVSDVKEGKYEATGLTSGKYTVRISAKGFVPYEGKRIEVVSNDDKRMNVILRVMGQAQEIFVYSDPLPTPIPEYLGGVRIIRGKALENLPETREALMAYLRVLVPRSSGPFGPTIIVDGFEGGVLPPKESIREIRINDNPFSAEFTEVGSNRVEILTKAGTENWQSGLFFNFNDASLNSRNPFADSRAPYQSRVFGGNISGPLVQKRLTFFTNIERVEHDDNAIIRATVLDPALSIQPFHRTILKPSRETTFSGALNLQLDTRNTLVARVRGGQENLSNDGIGGFSLQSRGYQSSTGTQTFQLTETAVLGREALNETRFEYSRRRVKQTGDDSIPTINVDQAFVGGGSEIGQAFNGTDSWTLANLTSWNHGSHVLKGGWDARFVTLRSDSSTNFGGTYTFTGRLAPKLDGNDRPVFGSDGQLLFESISNIESYRRTLLFQQQGLDPAVIRALGGGASQFSIAAGSASAGVRQYQLGFFLQHDWRVAHNFTMNSGVRYEGQNNLRRRSNYAPRLAFAWQPFSKTTLRWGSGLFYDRVGEQVMLQSQLFNGVIQRQYFAADPAILNLFPQKLTVDSLTSFIVPQAVWRTSDTLRMPYNINSSFTVERELPLKSTLAATVTYAHGEHVLRSRNVNAPLPDGARPLGNIGEIFQIESSGVSELRQLGLNTTHNVSGRVVLWTTYTRSESKSDTDGPFTFPANSFDLRQDYGRYALTARHTLYAGGWISMPGGIELTPMVMWRSGLPFNITTGRNTNGDTQFLERPAFAVNLAKPSVVTTRFGAFDLAPEPGQAIIPRNFGVGPGFAVTNLTISKIFPLGEIKPGPYRKRIVMWSARIYNLLNQFNPGTPVGNLSSPLFGQSNSAAGDFGFGSNSAGNRRIEFTVLFAF